MHNKSPKTKFGTGPRNFLSKHAADNPGPQVYNVDNSFDSKRLAVPRAVIGRGKRSQINDSQESPGPG